LSPTEQQTDGPLADVALPDGQRLFAVVKGRQTSRESAPGRKQETGEDP
jgi:hypothetical protein